MEATTRAACSLAELGEPLLERIALLSSDNPSARIVCRAWRDSIDQSGRPFSRPESTGSFYFTQAAWPPIILKSPKDPAASEGCLSWIRRNGRNVRAVELVVDNVWWFHSFAPLGQLSNTVELNIEAPGYLPDEGPEEEEIMELLSPLTALQQLRLASLPWITSGFLQVLTGLTMLKNLDLYDCYKFSDAGVLNQLTSLMHLSV